MAIRIPPLPAFASLFAFAAAVLLLSINTTPTPVRAAAATDDPDAACAGCHSAIYRSYKTTRMAQGSGPATQALISGTFSDRASGVEYKIFSRGGSAWMSFYRAATSAQGPLAGERKLEYFIGSGQHGRTYLYQQQGLWFELPINFYARRHAWDMAPAYENSPVMPAPLPVDPNCLHCHTTGAAQPETSARNAYAGAPFAQGGIGCSGCHGDLTDHLATQGRAPILNPARLSPERRDSACMQCHLEGDAVVYRPGRSLAQFVPGDRLSDIALYFVRASQASGGARAASQYEALLQSACRQAAGDSLTCTTCHDPHSQPAPAARTAFFRAKCLSCHTEPALATTHHPEQPDCAACHMPSRATSDISHEQVTDHNIQAIPRSPQARPLIAGEELVPVGTSHATPRDLGLAYAQIAQRGDATSARRALQLLTQAERPEDSDEQLHLNLGFLYQVAHQPDRARAEYERTLSLRPSEAAALSNLAVIEASAGQLRHASSLLETLLASDPSQTGAGINLATLQCRLGKAADAHNTAARLQALNPDAPAVRAFLRDGCSALLQTGASR